MYTSCSGGLFRPDKRAGSAKKMDIKVLTAVVVGGLIALSLWFGGFYLHSNLSWKGNGFQAADASITPVGWREPADQRSGKKREGYLTHDGPQGCHIKCAGVVIHTFTPTPPTERCDQLIAEQGQARCDAYARRR